MKEILAKQSIKPSIESLIKHFALNKCLSSAPTNAQDSIMFHEKFQINGGYAAVLIPIINSKTGLEVLLTRRASHLRHHPNQISFPGGRIEKHDDSHITAALREAEEEIGLPIEHTQIIGHLNDYYTVTGFCITPVIGVISDTFEPIASPNEVAEILHVPLNYLMNPQNFELIQHEYESYQRCYYSTHFGKHHIWGVTAGIIMDLYHALTQANQHN